MATYQNAGPRAFAIAHPYRPRPVGRHLTGPIAETMDTRPGARQNLHSANVVVDVNGLAYVTDYGSGLNILQHNGV